jgi:tripartite-type tricarboxylate transporter receptor subunit TctC
MSLYARVSYDFLKDFAPVTLVSSAPLVLVVHPSLPVKSVKELIALAKASPGKLNYGTGGSGSSAHVTTELFKTLARVDFVHVPYKGVAQATTDLIAGQIQVMFNATSTAVPHLRAGRVRGLAVSTAKRSSLAPGLPTVTESGLPGFDASIWQGILAPARTPVELVGRLNREITGLLAANDVREQMFSQGVDAMPSTPEQFGAYIATEIAKWARVVKTAGAKVD